MALIDRYIAEPHFRERHSRPVSGSTDAILTAAGNYRADDDRIFRVMIGLRELPMRIVRRVTRNSTPAPAPFGIDNFTLLERGDHEIVYGLAGRFWRSDFGLIHIADGTAFNALDEEGIAKLVLNFAVQDGGDGFPILSTETRVWCADRSARTRFAPYWYLIRPASGFIRRRILASIQKNV